jgi:hypothetical protein
LSAATVLLSAVTGCASPRALGRSALRHDERERAFSQIGDGEAAIREQWRARSLRLEARLRSEKQTSWFWSDVTLN